jgi:hypothetical protein
VVEAGAGLALDRRVSKPLAHLLLKVIEGEKLAIRTVYKLEVLLHIYVSVCFRCHC